MRGKSVLSGTFSWLVLSVLLLLLTACQPQAPEALPTVMVIPTQTETPIPSETPTPAPTSTATPAPITGRFATDPDRIGFIRVVHAAPNTAPIDVFIENVAFTRNLEYRLSTRRENIIAGTYQLMITPRNDPAPLVTNTITIEIAQSLIVVFSGTSDALNINVYEESNAPLQGNESRVNFIHAVPRAPLVKAQRETIDLSPELDFGQQSGVIVMPSGETTLSFGSSEQVIASTPITLRPRTHYTLIMVGSIDQPESITFLQFDLSVVGITQVRVINMTQLIDPIDLYLEDTLIAQNVTYGTAGPRTDVRGGSQEIRVYPTGADPANSPPLLQSDSVRLEEGATLALIVMGSADRLRLLPYLEDLSPTRPDFGRIAYINALESVPVAQIGSGSGLDDSILPIAYGQGSPSMPLNMGTHRLYWADANGGVIEDIPSFNMEGGRSYLYILTGRSDQPVIISEIIPTDEALIEATLAGPNFNPTEERQQTRVRITNALESQFSVDVVINNEPIATNLGYGQGTVHTPVLTGRLPVQVRISGTTQVIYQADVSVTQLEDYTLILFGPNEGANLYSITDRGFTIQTGRSSLRFINIGQSEEQVFNLVARPPSGQLPPPVDPRFTPVPINLPIGTDYLIEGITRLEVTFASLTPTAYDLILVDPLLNAGLVQVSNVTLEADITYDVIAYTIGAEFSPRIVLIRYPVSPG
ncbi:MAG: DUF4397 domain-containing protein [Anaerolineae bacterium]|nr:DUF4397 domain-containing protein [Anaerolineae bacterium]